MKKPHVLTENYKRLFKESLVEADMRTQLQLGQKYSVRDAGMDEWHECEFIGINADDNTFMFRLPDAPGVFRFWEIPEEDLNSDVR